MMLGVFSLVTAEFLPVSLLTPMANDLAITESLAGQAISTTALFAIASGLLVSSVTRGQDRRRILLGFTGLLILSNLLVALASNFAFLLVGRVLLGIALGGFWAMSTAIVMRLVPPDRLARGLSITVSGVAAAMLVAGPIASYLGHLIGWRNVFLGGATLGLLVFIVQFATLPSLPPLGHTSIRTLGQVLARRRTKSGLLAALLVFGGHLALFAYIRPFMENVDGITISGISTVLLLFGLANYAGTWLGGALPRAVTRSFMAGAPLVIAVVALALGFLPLGTGVIASLAVVWGLAFGTVPTTWSSWVAETVPDEAESAGGLLVAVINTAIASGAGVGGLILNYGSVHDVFAFGAYVLLAATALVLMVVSPGTRAALAEQRSAETSVQAVR